MLIKKGYDDQIWKSNPNKKEYCHCPLKMEKQNSKSVWQFELLVGLFFAKDNE